MTINLRWQNIENLDRNIQNIDPQEDIKLFVTPRDRNTIIYRIKRSELKKLMWDLYDRLTLPVDQIRILHGQTVLFEYADPGFFKKNIPQNGNPSTILQFHKMTDQLKETLAKLLAAKIGAWYDQLGREDKKDS